MATNGNKPLRFAALVRVSTEQQERMGESLRTQRAANERDVGRLGGEIVGWYGGQEHATPGWEKKEVDRLVSDAIKGKFDAVIVAYADRWSRDNVKSSEGLEVFKKHRIRFFVGGMEMNLFNPEHEFMLGVNAVVGQFIARQQAKKSIENRIERIKRGIPSAGRMPYGRTFDRATNVWGVDPKKQALIDDVANRFLAGESLPNLAREYGINHSNLCLTLREKCGDKWVVDFDKPDLNIRETVTVDVPRLLPEKTIKALQQRLLANRTYIRSGGRKVNDYLLSGHIFCAGCGYALCGQADRNGRLHYSHTHHEGSHACEVRPRPWVPAEKIEEEVVRQLFSMYGNPTAIQRAVKAAVPDCEKALKQRDRLTEEVGKIERARNTLLGLIEKDALTLEQAEKKLVDMRERETGLRKELDALQGVLADIPDEGFVQRYVEKQDGLIFIHDDNGNIYPANDVMSYVSMSRDEKRDLLRAVFGQPLGNGAPSGVYVSPAEGARPYRPKGWTFTIRGRLEFELVMRRGCQVPTKRHTELPAPPFMLNGNLAD